MLLRSPGPISPVCRTRTCGNEAQIGNGYGVAAQIIVGGSRIDNRQREVLPREAGQQLRHFDAAADPVDARIAIATATAPFRYRALRVGLDQADAVPIFHCGDCEPDRNCALPLPAFLRNQDDSVHRASPRKANHGAQEASAMTADAYNC